MEKGLTQKIRRQIIVTSLSIVPSPSSSILVNISSSGSEGENATAETADSDSDSSPGTRARASSNSSYLEFTDSKDIVLFPAVVINGDGTGFSVMTGTIKTDLRRRRLLSETTTEAPRGALLPEQEAPPNDSGEADDTDDGKESPTVTLTSDPLDASLVFGCVRTGEAIVTMNVTFAPIWQPYRPMLVTMRKRCGGRRFGLHVFESVAIEDEEGKPTERRRPAPESEATTAMRDGKPQPGYVPGHLAKATENSGKRRKDFHIVPGSETTTTFYVRVPVVELDAARGNTSVVPKQCHYDSGRLCRQLPLTNLSTPAITVKCVPDVCSPNMLGIGTSGPGIAGEVLGHTPATADEEPWTQAGDLVPLAITYHCTRTTEVVVSVVLSPSFYEPMEFSYMKMCAPSVWRIVALVGIALTLSVGLGAMVLCLPCPCWRGDSLLKRLVQGESMDL
jgi:hypothetical protein